MSNNDKDTRRIISIGHIDLRPGRSRLAFDPDALPVLPTRNLVLFPGTTIPISLEREQSRSLALAAEQSHLTIGIVCQRSPEVDTPDVADLYTIGVTAEVLKVFELPDGNNTAIVKAHDKFEILGPSEAGYSDDGSIMVAVSMLKETRPRKDDKDFPAVVDAVKEITLKMLENSDGSEDFRHNIRQYPDPVGLVNLICTQAPMPSAFKIDMLAMPSLKQRAMKLLDELTRQQEMMRVADEIQSRARETFEQQHRAAFLQNQMEAIRTELYGDADNEVDALRQRADATMFSPEVRRMFDKEMVKLSRLNPQSPEYSVQYAYLDTLLDLPWGKFSDAATDFAEARDILDKTHYGLRRVKERILEQIATIIHNPDNAKAPILCLVGPPGVGKTSIGQSIADALGRKFQRVALGGLHDEAEIRGHRRTYIGAMPGRIVEALRRAGTANPVILLDEVDKIGADFKGDPSAAMLEVLDPEQNWRFHDNYVDVDFDLSKVLFIATANTLQNMSQPLLDRMEIIDLSGYTPDEKVQIGRRHILPRLMRQYDVKPRQLSVSDATMLAIIERYTGESGVRQLEKALAKMVRRTVLSIVQGDKYPHRPSPDHLAAILGAPRYIPGRYEGNDFAGVVTGLAWTAAGGEILYIECSVTNAPAGAPPSGIELRLTGNLGDVMKESATIALQWVKSHAPQLDIPEEAVDGKRIHLHVPEGAIPKDGPSAGITMATAIASALKGVKVMPRLAMTGEITLRGKVLPVGGIKEKMLAAKRAGITDIILSEDNRKDIEELTSDPDNGPLMNGLTMHFVDTASQVIAMALTSEPGRV